MTIGDICRKHLLRFESNETARYTTRACLRCLKSFSSEGPHNRLCVVCRRADTYQFSYGALNA